VLGGLTPRERRLLFLAYFRGWTAKEISEADGVPLGTVKTRLRSTLIKLRQVHGGKET
jgi:RNA polymerase sigma-70 factor (ECF subfamily)